MDVALLISTFPQVYHMAHANAWAGIQRHGLLSTSALLDLHELAGDDRLQIESSRRRACVVLRHPVHGSAVIRDNKPMDDIGLKRALHGATPEEWYRLLNGKVFFWPNEERLNTLLKAAAYRNQAHCIITCSTRLLIDRYRESVWLCPMNSGCTKPFPHPRGPEIFQRIADYDFEYWRRKRNAARKAIVELAVDRGVDGILEIAERVVIRNSDATEHQIWQRTV